MRLRITLSFLSAGITAFAGASQAQELPVPCSSCSGGPSSFVTSGVASYVVNGAVGTINQQSDRAILNWQSFNIGSSNTVDFKQPSSTSAALNRIFQNDPSRILGALKANGEVYLINQNGILFGKGAQVDVGSLTASTLDVSDEVFTSIGLTGAINQAQALPAFSGDSHGDVRVEQGVRIRTIDGGRVLLIGSEVENAGRIETPSGQTLLVGAHDKVYVAAESEVRGLLVEVDTGGTATNLGEILSERGNTTLIGLAVNQRGRINATTSVNLNGSIHLRARDGASNPDQWQIDNGRRTPLSTRTGTVVLGEGSVTEILPEDSEDTSTDLVEQPASRVDVMGKTVKVEAGSRITVPGGIVDVTATTTPQNPLIGADRTAQVYIDDGAVIDVSGDDSTVVAMERNQSPAVRLLGDVTADSPVVRQGPLARQEIYFDLREGTLLANVTSFQEGIQRTAAERLSKGGEVRLSAEGDVVVKAGSQIDFAGGSVEYLQGYLKTTKLVSQGRIVDISEADPLLPYDGIFGEVVVNHSKWGVSETFRGAIGSANEFHAGYLEGKDAGSLIIDARGGVELAGQLRGAAERGRLQRNAPSALDAGVVRPFDEAPLGGRLSIATNSAAVFSSQLTTSSVSFGERVDTTVPLVLRPKSLQEEGISRLALSASGFIELPSTESLSLDPGAEVELRAERVLVDGTIRSAQGSVSLESSATQDGSVALGSSALIDVSGQWINDSALLNPDGVLAVDCSSGGSVTIRSVDNLTLAAGSRIDVSGGARLASDGAVHAGRAGSISLASRPGADQRTTLVLDGELLGFGMEQGGRLSIDANGFRVTAAGAGPQTDMDGNLVLSHEFFFSNGFGDFSFTARFGGFEVQDGTQVLLRPLSLQLLDNVAAQPTGTDMDVISERVLLPDFLRGTSSLDVSVERADTVRAADAKVRIGEGASVETEIGGSIQLQSDSDIVIDGVLSTPAGSIELALGLPDSANDTGFRADQAIHLGSSSRLLARGTALLEPSPLGIRQGEVFGGGSIALTAERGYVIAAQGSVIDISGTSQILDLPLGDFGQLEPLTVASNAGRISLTAAEGLLLSGSLLGTPGGESAEGGRLSVMLDSSKRDPISTVFNNPNLTQFLPSPPRIVIGAAAPIAIAPGAAVPDWLNGVAQLDPASVGDGQFSVLELVARPVFIGPIATAPGSISFQGDTHLSVSRSLKLDAPVIASDGGAVSIAAPYLAIGATDTVSRFPSVVAAGHGSLSVTAQHVDLVGPVAFTGFAPESDGSPSITLTSSGDIRAIGVRQVSESSSVAPGSLTSAVSLTLRAAQVYPATLTEYRIEVSQPGGRIVVEQEGTAAEALSAGGRLTLAASEIVQGGSLRAPFGEIRLEGTDRVSLLPGSVTSTSGFGLTVPFGQTEFGEEWVYPLAGLKRVFDGAPEKSIVLSSADVQVDGGATLDLRGGGELTAYEFTPGPGGSRDILSSTSDAGSFAVIPGYSNPFGVHDPLESPQSGIEPGRVMHLAAGSELPAGEYVVLPARYALLPGAYLITPTGEMDVTPGEMHFIADGKTSLVAGQLGYSGTSIRETRWSGFVVENGAQMRSRVDYIESKASTFFDESASSLVMDAGGLTIDADRSVALQGSLLSAAAQGGRGAQVDLVAQSIAVVDALTGSATRVEFLDSELEALRAESILLGGRRSTTGDKMRLDVASSSVLMESGATLSAQEIILAARDDVTIAGGARLGATGAAPTRVASVVSMEGDGAIARVSTGRQVGIERASAVGLTGRLSIDEGAALSTAGSITLDATSDLISAGELIVDGGSLSLGASRVSLGAVPQATGGLALSTADLSRLQGAELLLNSRSTVDIYGGISAGFDLLRVDTTGIRGFNNDGQGAQLTADRIALTNTTSSSAPGEPANGTGSLVLSAGEIALEGGTLSIEGFDSVRLAGAERITGNGNSKSLVDGDLQLDTGLLTAGTGAHVEIAAAGDLATTRVGASATLVAADALGAKLVLSGRNVTHGSVVEMHSGRVTLRATGSGGNVSLAADSVIDVSGLDRQFGDVVHSSPGGTVDLLAQSGGVMLGDRSRIDVSGSMLAGDAGTISIVAGGGVLVLGNDVSLRGEGAGDFLSGSIALDVAAFDDSFSALNSVLDAGGFHHSRSLRQRSGDIHVSASDVVRAAEITLVADSGAIDVAGRLTATAEQGGRVRLMAQDDLILRGTARIDARATAPGGDGGYVELATRQGLMTIESTNAADQSTIDVAAVDDDGNVIAGGAVRLRAPRVGTDVVGIANLAGRIAGTEAVEIEAFRVYDGVSVLDDATYAGISADTQQYMANAAAIESVLGIAGNPLYHLIAGEEINSAGDLSVSGRIDLQARRYDGEAGVLTLRAAGNLNIDASITDGFAMQSVGGQAARDVAQTGASWSYRLAGGAQGDSADPLSVVAGTGGVTLADNTYVRTGTGDIEIASGGDVTLTSASSVVYTIGENRGHGALNAIDAEILLRGDFVHNGGDVRVSAVGNLNGVVEGALPDWLPRFGGFLPGAPNPPSLRQDFPAMWAVAAEKFRQGFGALGGGDVILRAGGDANGVSAAVASSGLPLVFEESTPDVSRGGNLRLDVGGDIRGGVFTVTQGSADLRAGQAVRGVETALTPEPVAPILQVGDADFQITAQTGVEIETVFNPTMALQDPVQGVIGRGLGSKDAYFFTYTDASAVGITSIAGDVSLNARESNLDALHGSRPGYGDAKDALLVYPGSLTAVALEGGILAEGEIRLFPSATGTLDLFAGSDVTTNGSALFVLSDADTTLLPTLRSPARAYGDIFTAALDGHGPVPVHANDDRPARIVARSGIVGPRENGFFTVQLAKAARVLAGEDVRNLNLSVQHHDDNDYSIVEAVRDIVFPTFRDAEGDVANNGNRIDVNGPGVLHMLAGRDVDLGASIGIESRGNLINPALPAAGAGTTVMTGLAAGADFDGFRTKYLEDSQKYAAELAAFVQRSPASGGASDLERFAALAEVHQREFLLSVLFNELREAGVAASSGDKSQFDPGFEAIETLFPNGSYPGDLRSFLSKITTLDGGDINVVVPGGLVNAGVASSTALTKEADELGIVIQRAGNLSALSNDDFLVNQSRVFALDGGDILIWSSEGDIDAGRGAKSALAIPPPIVNFDANGNATVEFPPAIAGSGIRAAVTTIGREPGDVFLFAPVGVVDAGDAGIGSAGNITIAATEVIGADNIDVGGIAVGIPIDSGGLGASLAGVSSVANSASTTAEAAVDPGRESVEEEAPMATAALGWLDVFVVGFGEEVCKPDNVECIKRNQKKE